MSARVSARGSLEALGLSRPELRAWAMYDWAISAMQVMIMTAVFPIYFVKVAGAGLPPGRPTQILATANAIALAISAVLSPILGAVADYGALKKRLLAAFMLLGAGAIAAMFAIRQGDIGLAATCYVVALVGATGSLVFYEALLPHIARPAEIDRVSTAGYAMGYVGGGVLLAFCLALIQRPDWFGLHGADATLPTRVTFVLTALWWLLFSVPLFRRVAEPSRRLERGEPRRGNPVVVAFRRLSETVHDLRGYRNAFVFLLAFLIYNDGIQTIISTSTAYGTEIGIGTGALITAILLVQFVGIPFSFLFGLVAGRIGAKRAVFIGLATYTAISILGYYMRTATHFFILATLVGVVQGGTQALSRSLFARMIPQHKSGEFFGFYSVFEKFAGIFGPLVFASIIGLTGQMRNAILSVIAFFALGALLLARVDVDAGMRAAREAERVELEQVA